MNDVHSKCYYLVGIMVVYILVVTAMLLHADRAAERREIRIRILEARLDEVRLSVQDFNRTVRAWKDGYYGVQ